MFSRSGAGLRADARAAWWVRLALCELCVASDLTAQESAEDGGLSLVERAWFPWALVLLLAVVGVVCFLWSYRLLRARELRLEELVGRRTQALQVEIDRREQIEVELREQQDTLDERIVSRSAELAEANRRLELELDQRTLLEKELVGAQRMEGIGLLAGGIAHDLNNLLTAVIGFSGMARGNVEDDHPAAEDLDEIQLAASNAADLTQRLLNFARRQPMHEVVADLNEIVLSFSGILQGLVGESCGLRLELSSVPCPVVVDRVQFEQVIVNLVLNAKHAASADGSIVVRVMCAGDRCLLEVEDDGVGIAEDRLESVFDPFETTKSEGTGLGLAISRSIIERLLGSLDLRSELGRGSCFIVDLPRSAQQPDRCSDEKDVLLEQPRGPALRVLIVEDQELVRHVTSRALVAAGHHVVVARDGAEALERFGQKGSQFDLVLSDVVMPGLSGPDLIEALRRIEPRLSAVLMTGYSPESIIERIAVLGVPLIKKPFSSAELVRTIARVGAEARRRRSPVDDQDRSESSLSS